MFDFKANVHLAVKTSEVMAIGRYKLLSLWKAKSFWKSTIKLLLNISLICSIEDILFNHRERKSVACNARSVQTCPHSGSGRPLLAGNHGTSCKSTCVFFPLLHNGRQNDQQSQNGNRRKAQDGNRWDLLPFVKQWKVLFFSWSNVVCDGDSNRIGNLHHRKLHVRISNLFPLQQILCLDLPSFPFYISRLSAVGSWGVALTIWGLSGIAALCGALSWAGETMCGMSVYLIL